MDIFALLNETNLLEFDLSLQLLDRVFSCVLILILGQCVLALSPFGVHSLSQVAWEGFPRVLCLLHEGQMSQSELIGHVLDILVRVQYLGS